MSLPILQSSSYASPDTLVRLFYQTEADYIRHLSEETQLDIGRALHNAELNRVHDANVIHDAALPEGMSPADAVAQAEEHFRSVHGTLWRWHMNPSAPADRVDPLSSHLLEHGYVPKVADILYLARATPAPIREVGGLKIIPSRASFRHARELAEEGAKRWDEPQLADAAMLHLDSPQWDSLLALRDGKAVAHIAVMAMGEVGRIDDVFVSESYRRQGIGKTMMSRALEICARSLFKHVMLCTGQDNAAAQAMYTKLGFKKVGTITALEKQT